MNIDRQSLLFYEALAGGFFALAAGFLHDTGMPGTAIACALIAFVAALALFMTYLTPPKD